MSRTRKTIEAWNRDEIPVLAVQPQALSHGVNMQKGSCGTVLWYGVPDSLLTFQQLNTRVHRQGVRNPVAIKQILTRKTVDMKMNWSINRKALKQQTFLDRLTKIGTKA